MDERIRTWLAERGFTEARPITLVRAGLGDTTLWRISHPAGDSDLLVRVFTTGKDDAAARERVAMEAAARHGVPVPEVVLLDDMDGQPVMVTTWCPGEPALQTLQRSPADAHRTGTAMGEALGRLHLVTAPNDLVSLDRWIAGSPKVARRWRRFETSSNACRMRTGCSTWITTRTTC